MATSQYKKREEEKARRAGLQAAQDYVASLSTAKRAKRRVVAASFSIENHVVSHTEDGATVRHTPTGYHEVALRFTVYEKPEPPRRKR